MWKAWLIFAGRIARSNLGRLPAPYKLTYAVTDRCNARCRHCGIWRRAPSNELCLDEIALIAERAPRFSWIDFTGGEPVLRGDFYDIIAAFTRHNPELLFVHFPTNGLETDRIVELCGKIAKKRPPRLVVTVSLDGPPDLHDTLRGVPGAFSRAMATYARLRKNRELDVYFGLTLFPENLHALPATVQAVQGAIPGFTAHDLHLNLPQVSGHYYHNTADCLPDGRLVAGILQDFIACRRRPRSPFELLESGYLRMAVKFMDDRHPPVPCAALDAACFMSADGTIYPCSIWSQPLGNIRETDFYLAPLLGAKPAEKLRRLIRQQQCPGCWSPCEAYPSMLAHVFDMLKQIS